LVSRFTTLSPSHPQAMDVNIHKALTDRLYDKRKAGALE
jgi:hypothetical protein